MDREKLTAAVESYIPCCEQETADKALLLHWLRSGEDMITRGNPTTHLTASAWVVSPDRKKVLMAYHNIYDSWAWLGGHADGDWDLQAVAAREATEESGIHILRPLGDGIASLEVLTVDGHEKKGRYVSSHLHLNVTYLFEADPAEAVRCKADENSQVGWINVEDIPNKSTEPWFVRRIYSKLIQKAETL